MTNTPIKQLSQCDTDYILQNVDINQQTLDLIIKAIDIRILMNPNKCTLSYDDLRNINKNAPKVMSLIVEIGLLNYFGGRKLYKVGSFFQSFTITDAWKALKYEIVELKELSFKKLVSLYENFIEINNKFIEKFNCMVKNVVNIFSDKAEQVFETISNFDTTSLMSKIRRVYELTIRKTKEELLRDKVSNRIKELQFNII